MIARLRELLRAASDGPWYVLDDGYLSTDPDRWANDALLAWDHDGLGQSWRNKADAALIVEAVNALPELLDAHDRMAARLTELDELNRLIVSYADLTHDVVTTGGDWRDIAQEWGRVVDRARAALAVPKEENPDA